MKKIPLPHFNERKSPVDMLVFHCTPTDLATTVDLLNQKELSAHYLFDFNGEITQCVEEKDRAWHAGEAKWRGIEDINSHSIGIELCKRDGGQTPYNEAQIEKLIHFATKIIKKYNIKPQMVVAHSDVSSTRKYDPGISFPWKRLSKEGIGLWYQIKHADKMIENDIGKLLEIIGYDVSDISAAQYAFCRRFLPEFVEVIDIDILIANPYPKDFDLSENEKFIRTLKAVAYSYSQI